MAKQIYIDENGNENLVSGTINTGKMLPMSTTEPTSMVADRIEACETALGNKPNTSTFTVKKAYTTTALSCPANDQYTHTFTVNDAVYGIVSGFAITTNTAVVMLQAYFDTPTTIQIRVRNITGSAQSFNLTVWYI